MKPETVWAGEGSYPPRTGNLLDLYVDGEESFAAIYDAMLAAKSYIYATFAYVDFDFFLKPGIIPNGLLSLLTDRAKQGIDVRLLIWSPMQSIAGTIHDPAHEFPGTNGGPGTVQVRWDQAKVKFPYPESIGCHHQKSFVMDGTVAFVGGINSYQPYWDTTSHQPVEDRRIPKSIPRPVSDFARQGYPPLHDLFARIQDPCIEDVEANFRERWNNATFKHPQGTHDAVAHPAIAQPSGNLTLQITRTIAPRAYPTTPYNGETSIQESYARAISAAEKLIYFEDQYYYDAVVCEAILKAAQRGVKIIGLLCLQPDDGTPVGIFDQALEAINKTRIDFAGYFDHENIGLFSPMTAAQDTVIADQYQYSDIYVHAKLLIVDDVFMTLGSANISFTSMEFHSELNVVSNDPVVARTLRKRLWEEHFQRPQTDPQLDDPVVAFDLWCTDAGQNKEARTFFRKPFSRIYPFAKDAPGGNLIQNLV